jgi:hypothetical protein
VASEPISVLDSGRRLGFTFEHMLAYHGGGSPGGVAHAFQVLQRALPLLSPSGPPERRELRIVTAFGGPGARDGFELVTRAVTGERFTLEPALARPDLGPARERFVFRLDYGDRAVLLVLRDGFVSEDFIELTRRLERSEEEERRLTEMKAEMAARVMAAEAAEVYDAAPVPEGGVDQVRS